MFKGNNKKCSVCGEQEMKYKCPTCRAPYCSATCCKHHQVKLMAGAGNEGADNLGNIVIFRSYLHTTVY